MPTPPRTVEIHDHIIDTGLMMDVIRLITGHGGTFEFLHFNPGGSHEELSHWTLSVQAPSDEKLAVILEELRQRGAQIHEVDEVREARLGVVEMDGVAPEDFYSTTIFPTDVFVRGRWLSATKRRMDAVIVVDEAEGTAQCRLMRDLRKGEKIVLGFDGVRVHEPKKTAGDGEAFAFMSSGASSERRVEVMVESIADEIHALHQRGGHIVFVAGPVVIHTGGADYFAQLVRWGYVSALLSGNAIAAHDIEHSMFGTSLGVALKTGKGVPHGHRHHLVAINRVRRCGSIAKAVEAGVVKSGIFYELVKANVPFSLAGSIRDDGPLPDTQMDLLKAQADYQRLLYGADLIVMLSTMLHSIGVGNMTPSGVKLVCVDFSPSVVTKLADRGSVESVPIVTDVGLFLKVLVQRLGQLRAREGVEIP